MPIGKTKGSVNLIYCDYDSHFHSADLYHEAGFKMPDDFDLENSGSVGNPRFQVIRDLRSGWCFYNHEGNLYPFVSGNRKDTRMSRGGSLEGREK
jgi:hypothetical protein